MKATSSNEQRKKNLSYLNSIKDKVKSHHSNPTQAIHQFKWLSQDSLNSLSLTLNSAFPLTERPRAWWERCGCHLIKVLIGLEVVSTLQKHFILLHWRYSDWKCLIWRLVMLVEYKLGGRWECLYSERLNTFILYRDLMCIFLWYFLWVKLKILKFQNHVMICTWWILELWPVSWWSLPFATFYSSWQPNF